MNHENIPAVEDLAEVEHQTARANGWREKFDADTDELIRLREALARIEGLVCGDKVRWNNQWATTSTRGLIADICDCALDSAPVSDEVVEALEAEIERLRRFVPACYLTTTDLVAELGAAHRRFDMACGERSGSPGEQHYERIDEIVTEQKRRFLRSSQQEQGR